MLRLDNRLRHCVVETVHILWTSEGMSCDGDSVSITAAMRPSLEEVVLGLIPGLPRVVLHNKVLAYSLGGEDFMAAFHQAARGELDPFVLVVVLALVDLAARRGHRRHGAAEEYGGGVDRAPGPEVERPRQPWLWNEVCRDQ